MSHNTEHSMFDSDPLFVIDEDTRDIVYQGEEPPAIMQYDHLAEIMTFEMPRFIDGHDMMLCNAVQVHFINISVDGRYNVSGYDEIYDLSVPEDNENAVRFCWSVPFEATQLEGTLHFVIAFKCVDMESGTIKYRWNTERNGDLIISAGIDNSEEWRIANIDFLERWKAEVLQEGVDDALAKAKESGEFDGFTPTLSIELIDGGYRLTITDVDGSKSIDILNGQKGDNITVVSVSESTEDAGNNVVTFSDGKTLTVKNGNKGGLGDPGFSPAVSISDIAGGHRITIADKDGEKSFDVMNGEGAGDVTSAMLSTAIENHDTAADAHDDIRNSIPKNPSDIGAQPVGDYLTAKDIGDVAIAQIKEEFAVGATEEEISSVHEWVQATSPSGFNQRQRSCCYGNGFYVIAGTAGQMIYSTDGVTWTFVTAFTSAVITGLAYGNGRFVAVDSEGNIYSAALPTETWELVYQNPVIIESVRYLNNRFVSVGSEGFLATSLDAKNWTQYTIPTTNNIIDSAYGNGYFIAVGANGTILRSINLTDWFDHSIADFGDIRTTLFIGNGFVLGGASGKIAYSTDGADWTMATNNTTSTISWIRAFAYAEKRIYAVMYTSAGKGEIWISTDNGATWQVVLTTVGRLWCAAYGDGRFVTSGDSGAIYTLDLGIEWTDEEPAEGASIWHRYIGTLSSGDKIISESYKANKPTPSDLGLTTENWTFTLEDGSTVTKAVYVK